MNKAAFVCALACLALLGVCAGPRLARAGSLQVTAGVTWRGESLGSSHNASWTGVLWLELPLDRVWAPRLTAGPLADGERRHVGQRKRTLAQDSPETSHDPDSEGGAAPSPTSHAPRLDFKMAVRLVSSALRQKGDLEAARRIESMSVRARTSAALPELMLRALRSTDESLRLSPSGNTAWDFTHTGGAGLVLEARATWKLDKLVFADQELVLERMRLQRDAARERLMGVVLKYLSQWLTTRARLRNPGLEPERLWVLEAELDFFAGALDALTGGAFSAELNRRAPSASSEPGK